MTLPFVLELLPYIWAGIGAGVFIGAYNKFKIASMRKAYKEYQGTEASDFDAIAILAAATAVFWPIIATYYLLSGVYFIFTFPYQVARRRLKAQEQRRLELQAAEYQLQTELADFDRELEEEA